MYTTSHDKFTFNRFYFLLKEIRREWESGNRMKFAPKPLIYFKVWQLNSIIHGTEIKHVFLVLSCYKVLVHIYLEISKTLNKVRILTSLLTSCFSVQIRYVNWPIMKQMKSLTRASSSMSTKSRYFPCLPSYNIPHNIEKIYCNKIYIFYTFDIQIFYMHTIYSSYLDIHVYLF